MREVELAGAELARRLVKVAFCSAALLGAAAGRVALATRA